MKNELVLTAPSVKMTIFHGNENKELIESIIHLRMQSWRSSGNHTTDLRHLVTDPLEYDKETIHFAAFKENELIGSARLTPIQSIEDLNVMQFYSSLNGEKLPLYLYNRLVVHPEIRHCKVANLLTKYRVEYAKKYLPQYPQYVLVRQENRDYYISEFGFSTLLDNLTPSPDNALPYSISTILKI